MPETKKTVSLALGSGGARGFAHIGVIEVLKREGFDIRSVSGSSAGALVGGIFCADRLEPFKQWAIGLNKLETFRLMDFTFSGQGVVKGQKVMETLRTLLGEISIEDFSQAYTAVAIDLRTREEIWLQKGDLFEVIRASSAIPSFVQPYKMDGRILVDGGVLNPLPIEPLLPLRTDLLIAVNINAEEPLIKDVDKSNIPKDDEEPDAYMSRMVSNMRSWLNLKKSPSEAQEMNLGYVGLLSRTFDFMQDRMCLQSIQIHRPDIVVNVPRSVSATLEFYRAQEIIDEGVHAAETAVREWRERQLIVHDGE
ncbi:MAG: patatin-like phospholipase family protein [Flavobacteriales bacterium]|nr:patatin-like phospholipase family protein [Flavobacteriales bacterium]